MWIHMHAGELCCTYKGGTDRCLLVCALVRGSGSALGRAPSFLSTSLSALSFSRARASLREASICLLFYMTVWGRKAEGVAVGLRVLARR